jgi:hypothetical protein
LWTVLRSPELARDLPLRAAFHQYLLSDADAAGEPARSTDSENRRLKCHTPPVPDRAKDFQQLALSEESLQLAGQKFLPFASTTPL